MLFPARSEWAEVEGGGSGGKREGEVGEGGSESHGDAYLGVSCVFVCVGWWAWDGLMDGCLVGWWDGGMVGWIVGAPKSVECVRAAPHARS